MGQGAQLLELEQMVTRVPTKHTAGLTFALSVCTPAYPAPAWSLQLLLRGPAVIDIASAPSGADHSLVVPANTQGGWRPGKYIYSLRATDGTQVLEIESGSLLVAKAMADIAAGEDVRHIYEITLDNINAVLAKRATHDQMRYRIESGGSERELWRVPTPELLELQARYRALVRKLRRPGLAVQRIRPIL